MSEYVNVTDILDIDIEEIEIDSLIKKLEKLKESYGDKSKICFSTVGMDYLDISVTPSKRKVVSISWE